MASDVKISIIMPCLNEEKAVGKCVRTALAGIKKLKTAGEVVVIDNGSTDNSVNEAKKAGARIVFEKKRGYGNAVLRGIKEAKGEIIVMGDCDASYDFKETGKLIDKLSKSYDLVIGSRFKGKIAKGAMPFSHQYIGTPMLNFIFSLFFQKKNLGYSVGIQSF